jgi:hypothetical protein
VSLELNIDILQVFLFLQINNGQWGDSVSNKPPYFQAGIRDSRVLLGTEGYCIYVCNSVKQVISYDDSTTFLYDLKIVKLVCNELRMYHKRGNRSIVVRLASLSDEH